MLKCKNEHDDEKRNKNPVASFAKDVVGGGWI